MQAHQLIFLPPQINPDDFKTLCRKIVSLSEAVEEMKTELDKLDFQGCTTFERKALNVVRLMRSISTNDNNPT